MSGERHITVGPEDDGARLDRWLKKCAPDIPYALAQKLIRKGAIRIDGVRGKADSRLTAGQDVRLPAVEDRGEKRRRPEKILTDEDRVFIESLVLYDDGDLVIFNKPAGLASQGGGEVEHHIDAYFPLLARNETAPRLIHRLDRDTSGLLLAARSAEAVRRLGKSFKDRRVGKTYWAATLGTPDDNEGTVRAPLAKAKGPIKDKMAIDDGDGKPAETDFSVLDRLGKQAAFIAFRPRTGRTHQIRVHAAEILGCPIIGDGKYGGKGEALAALETLALSDGLHLHARRLSLRHPLEKRVIDITAPLPASLENSWRALGFDPAFAGDPFEGEEI